MSQNVFVQMVIIVVLAAAFGITTNLSRKDPIDWIAKRPLIVDTPDDTLDVALPDNSNSNLPAKYRQGSTLEKYIKLSLDEAYTDIYQGKLGIFIDSRYAEEYEAGHIDGAVTIPYDEVFENAEKLADIPFDKLIAIYCAGSDCNSSYILAEELIMMGYKRVFIFEGGWLLWQEANYPTK